MKIDNFGQVIITEQEAFEALYSGKIQNLENVLLDGNILKYNNAKFLNADNIPKLKSSTNIQYSNIELFDQDNQNNWFVPTEYKKFHINEWLLNQCTNEIQTLRVKQELELFEQHKMFHVLLYLKYLVDTMRENKILWGVGRGSSVSSYVLYLIGIHKIDSIRYNLDIKEFLK